jgi:hypothetical protein
MYGLREDARRLAHISPKDVDQLGENDARLIVSGMDEQMVNDAIDDFFMQHPEWRRLLFQSDDPVSDIAAAFQERQREAFFTDVVEPSEEYQQYLQTLDIDEDEPDIEMFADELWGEEVPHISTYAFVLQTLKTKEFPPALRQDIQDALFDAVVSAEVRSQVDEYGQLLARTIRFFPTNESIRVELTKHCTKSSHRTALSDHLQHLEQPYWQNFPLLKKIALDLYLNCPDSALYRGFR